MVLWLSKKVSPKFLSKAIPKYCEPKTADLTHGFAKDVGSRLGGCRFEIVLITSDHKRLLFGARRFTVFASELLRSTEAEVKLPLPLGGRCDEAR